jgi:hypothetical protein
VQELESEQRACDPVVNVLTEIAENNEQLLGVAVYENIGNQANDNDKGDVMERLLDAAAVENIGNQANNNDNHDVVDAPDGNVPDIAAVENMIIKPIIMITMMWWNLSQNNAPVILLVMSLLKLQRIMSS